VIKLVTKLAILNSFLIVIPNAYFAKINLFINFKRSQFLNLFIKHFGKKNLVKIYVKEKTYLNLDDKSDISIYCYF